MTALLAWGVFAAIPVLMLAAQLRAWLRRDKDHRVENLAMVLGYLGAAAAGIAQQAGVA